MRLCIVSDPVDRILCDVLVLWVPADQRPLKGATGLADWRLNGALSRLVLSGKMAGDHLETTLVASQGRLRAEKVLLVGLGPLSATSTVARLEAITHAARSCRRLGATAWAMAAPEPAGLAGDVRSAIQMWAHGVAAGLGGDRAIADQVSVALVVEPRAEAACLAALQQVPGTLLGLPVVVLDAHGRRLTGGEAHSTVSAR